MVPSGNPPDALPLVSQRLDDARFQWGGFRQSFSNADWRLAGISRLHNLRCRITRVFYGDQAMFVKREVFRAQGGFPDIALMEDIALSKRLKRVGRPLCLRQRAITSGRRWEKNGVLATVLLMWRLRLSYLFGADPAALARRYGYGGGND